LGAPHVETLGDFWSRCCADGWMDRWMTWASCFSAAPWQS
jgi:hypothetical protein